MIADLSKQAKGKNCTYQASSEIGEGEKRKLPPGSLRVCGFLSINVVCIFGGLLLIIALGGLIGHTGVDLLPDTDFNLPLPMRSEICFMINFNL